jgi:hypothetical protein
LIRHGDPFLFPLRGRNRTRIVTDINTVMHQRHIDIDLSIQLPRVSMPGIDCGCYDRWGFAIADPGQ